MVEEIECLADAFKFLQEWPNNRRGPIFATAFRACAPMMARFPFPLHARLSPASIGQNPRGRLCSYALDDGTENRSRWRDGITDVAA
ncbi:hypothetical protein [Mesorhizobium sp.]|uniref:hypothetical protein n=1 Tax=Mesorhizobium sp. TaxID=1871066 RepID=UPI00338DFD37